MARCQDPPACFCRAAGVRSFASVRRYRMRAVLPAGAVYHHLLQVYCVILHRPSIVMCLDCCANRCTVLEGLNQVLTCQKNERCKSCLHDPPAALICTVKSVACPTLLMLAPFAGMICMMLGGLIVSFDYPQLQYLEGVLDAGGYAVVAAPQNMTGQEIYGRLLAEFYAGMGLLVAGAVLCAHFAISGILQKRAGQR